ncbi:MAG: ATP-binding protein [Nitriliruptorales bacterium]|nr:ATP-binding protein [Nitriliruptorales bacterium]
MRITFDTHADLAGLRRAVREAGRDADLSEDRVDDLGLAVSELATNSLQHGGGTGQLTIWQVGPQLVCEVRDSGHMQASAASAAPDPLAERGRGLWIVDQASDEIRRELGRDGTITQVIMYRHGERR